jgi:hypothetical protein
MGFTSGSYALNVVKLHQSGAPASAAEIVFSIDSEGSAKSLPVVEWISARQVRITVLNGALIEHWSTRYQGIEIGVDLK